MAGSMIERILFKGWAIPAAFALSMHYRTWPTVMYNGLTGLLAQESQYDYDIPNFMYDATHTASGGYQITDSSSFDPDGQGPKTSLKDRWKNAKLFYSIPLQTLDTVLLHYRKTGGGGLIQMIKNHAGSAWLKIEPDYPDKIVRGGAKLPVGVLEIGLLGVVVAVIVIV